jgi:SAM-dependent methyltransferase
MQYFSPLSNTLRLSFDSLDAYATFMKANVTMSNNIWIWHEILGDRDKRFEIPGICEFCTSQTMFIADPHPSSANTAPFNFKNRVYWWASAQCTKCGLSSFERAAMRVFYEGYKQDHDVYHVGYYSRFRNRLSERISNLVSSQYFENRSPGDVVDGVQHEDISNLSFDSHKFDALICMEILEHVPNYQTSLSEMARILKPDGRAILTFPWLGSLTYSHLTRAEMLPDGSINHILEPEYHGDPASSQKILSFRSFGWQILDELRQAGFRKATAEFILGPLHGYMTILNPIIVAVR